MSNEMETNTQRPSKLSEQIGKALHIAVRREIAELRRLKLPVIVSQNGKPVDINPDTNPEAPPWEE